MFEHVVDMLEHKLEQVHIQEQVHRQEPEHKLELEHIQEQVRKLEHTQVQVAGKLDRKQLVGR